MSTDALRLINFERFEAWPALLLRARGNADARAVHGAEWVLRRKRDGRFLATVSAAGSIHRLLPAALAQARGRTTEAELVARLRGGHARRPAALALTSVRRELARLGVPAGYGPARGLPQVAEPAWLACAGFDRYRRPLWLTPETASAWRRMRAAAARQGIALDAISGYRSHAYQLGIFLRKRARGIALADILAVNAAPGYSEHHSGRALDIGTPAEPPAEESFEATAAFAWLTGHAAGFGFAMSYPRGNPHGIVHEPWHWCLR